MNDFANRKQSTTAEEQKKGRRDARVGGKRAILVTEAIQNEMNVSPVKVVGNCQDGDCIEDARM